MRIVSFNDFVVGALRGEEVVDLSPAIGDLAKLPWAERLPAVAAHFAELRSAIERLAKESSVVSLASVQLRAPVPRPPKLLCAIGNYGNRPQTDSPLEVDFTFKSPDSVVGPGDTVVLADVAATGFEAEATLGVVIGRDAKNLSGANALSYVLGYTAFLDVFAAGLGRNIGTFFGKSLDTLGPMGPCVVTTDELADPQNLRVKLMVNGQTQQDFSTAEMLMPVAGVLGTATAIMTLHPGDVVTCGSPAVERVLLKHGDEAAVEIERIGRFSVRVDDPARRVWAA